MQLKYRDKEAHVIQTGVKHEVIIEAQISSYAWGKKENNALTKGNSNKGSKQKNSLNV